MPIDPTYAAFGDDGEELELPDEGAPGFTPEGLPIVELSLTYGGDELPPQPHYGLIPAWLVLVGLAGFLAWKVGGRI